MPIGAAVADYDGNGCLDVFVVQNGNWSEHRPRGQVNSDFQFDADNGNPNQLFAGNCSTFRRAENAGVRGTPALQIDLAGATGADALGARITVSAANDSRTAVLNSRTAYLSQDSRVIHVGLGNASRADVRVAWPDGTVTRLEDVAAGQRIVVSKAGIQRRLPFEEA